MAMGAALLATSAMSEATTAYLKTRAVEAQSKYQRDAYTLGADIAETNAKRSIQRSEFDVQQIEKRTRRLVGAQKAAAAGQGVDVASENVMGFQDEALRNQGADTLTTRNNAWLEAWGYKTVAQEYRSRGLWSELAADNEVKSTVLTGGLKTATTALATYDMVRKK